MDAYTILKPVKGATSICYAFEFVWAIIPIESAYLKVEGTCDGDYGYVVAVLQITNKSRGFLKETTGFAAYTVTYTCMVLRPFRGEVLDVLVTSVSKVCPLPLFQGFYSRLLSIDFCSLLQRLSLHHLRARYMHCPAAQWWQSFWMRSIFCSLIDTCLAENLEGRHHGSGS